jgi:hypothetical protein
MYDRGFVAGAGDHCLGNQSLWKGVARAAMLVICLGIV